MTFKALSNIIKKRKEQPMWLAPQTQDLQREQEIAEAQAVINTLRANHYRAYHEREVMREQEHLGKKFYERSEEDNRKDCTIDERFWDFFGRAHVSESPEVRYQRERNPDHGFGHESKVHGPHDKCIPDCRFYEPKGKLTIFDILEDYRGYQQFEQIWQTYKELQKEESLTS